MTPVSRRNFGGAEDAGIYTRAQLSEFWDKNFIRAASGTALQKFSRELTFPAEQFTDRNNILIMLRARTSMWTI